MADYVLDFGMANAGATPTFVSFQRADTFVSLTPPAPSAVALDGRVSFSYDWTSAPSGVTSIWYKLKILPDGTELGGVIYPDGSTDVSPAPPLPPSSSGTGKKTLAQIRLLAKQRADMENSAFVSASEWLSYINGSYAELYDLLVTEYGEDYYTSVPYEFTTDGVSERFALPDGTVSYALPDGSVAPAFYKCLGVDLRWPAALSGWLTLRRFNFGERNALVYPGASSSGIADAGSTVRVHYVPRIVPLVSDGDYVDGVSGWEELIVVDAARKAKAKEESDTSDLEREKAGLLARIQSTAANRDAGEAPVVTDVYSNAWVPPLRYRLNGNSLWLRKIAAVSSPILGGAGMY